MKRFILACCCVFLCAAAVLYAYYYEGFHLNLRGSDATAETFVRQDGDTIYLDQGDGFREFEIRGVDLSTGIPGHFPTDYAIDKETFLQWFAQIQEMGANTIRVYMLQGTAFYEAFYEYNRDNPNPLYLIHGVWIEDYAQDSHMSVFDDGYLPNFRDDVRAVIDAVHGNRPLRLGSVSGTGGYVRDVSPWVIGYILGTGWVPETVVYTDLEETDRSSYQGEYLSTAEGATPFESMLAQVGDEALRYETERYGKQRLISFESAPSTDPFDYSTDIESHFEMYASFDVEHVVKSERVVSGLFAAYQVYPYYLEFMRYLDGGSSSDAGADNFFFDYVKRLNDHHDLPVVISEYGMPSSRGMMQLDTSTGRNMGGLNERQQGEYIARSYQDVVDAGSAGSLLFSWQDEWHRRSWNTMANVDLLKTPFWSDAQTGGQSFGLLAFDPGEERSVSYVDGDDEEWTEADVIGEADGTTLSMKYDEKYVYLMARGDAVGEDTPLYLPIDTTQNSGSTACDDPAVSFDRAADFLVVIDGEDESRVLVQERYDALRATFLRQTTGEDPYVDAPDRDTATFNPIKLVLQTLTSYAFMDEESPEDERFEDNLSFYQTYETGRLVHGDANPAHEDFDSLADFCFGDGFVEVKIPWQMLNFSNPSDMQIHDDYYEHYGVENARIDRMYVGVGTGNATIPLFERTLQGWGENVTYHERLKEGYYIVQDVWTSGSASGDLQDGLEKTGSGDAAGSVVVADEGETQEATTW